MTPPLADDEKVCPFCAETIKAAAIRCRYCQSDLPPVEASVEEPVQEPKKEPEKTERRSDPAGVEEHRPITPLADGTDGTDGSERPGGFWNVAGSGVVTASLTVLLVGLLVATFLLGRDAGADGTASDGRLVDQQVNDVAITQGSDLVQDALSYSFKDFDKVRRANKDHMTAAFAKKYETAMDKAEKNTKQYQVTLRTTVVAGGVESLTATRATLLLFVNQVTSAEKGKNTTPTTQINRTVVTMVRGEGDWRISEIDTLSGDASTVTTN